MYKFYYLFFILGVEAFCFKPISNNYLWKLLSDPLKENARNFFIKRAEIKGIPWTNLKNKYENKRNFTKINNIYENIVDNSLKYPDYYLQPFHGYDEGNLNWQAATENEAATLSISSYYWKGYSVDDSAKFMRYNFTDRIKNYINKDIDNILDLGCSIGISTNFIKDAFGDDKNIYGIDLSPYFISIAEFNELTTDSLLKFSHQNAENLNFNDDNFDLITSCFLFHEVPTIPTRNIFTEVYRTLNKGGCFAILDLNQNELEIKLDKNYLRKLLFESTEPHIYEYYNNNIEYELKRSGFEDIKKFKNDPYNSVWLATKK